MIYWQGRRFEPDEFGRLREMNRFREHLAKLVWRDAHGAIPPGMLVALKDGDERNCAIENLELRPDPLMLVSAQVRGTARALYEEYSAGKSVIALARREGRDPRELLKELQQFLRAKEAA